MGMIQTILKSCKPEADAGAYKSLLESQARQLVSHGDQDGDRPEGAKVTQVTEANFAEHWNVQENIRKDSDTEPKYLQRAKDGRLFAIEVEW